MSDNLVYFSNEALRDELKRREAEMEKPQEKLSLPVPLEQPDFDALIDYVVKSIKNDDDNGFADEDTFHYIAEKALTTIYGEDFFDWYNVRFK